MTQEQVDRIQALGDKMDAAAKLAGRTWTDTADLTAAELIEWRLLMRRANDAEAERAAATVRQIDGEMAAACLGGADDGRIGIMSDAAW